jgi:predicted RNase H-like nuclease (RuvC/YqgF family)
MRFLIAWIMGQSLHDALVANEEFKSRMVAAYYEIAALKDEIGQINHNYHVHTALQNQIDHLKKENKELKDLINRLTSLKVCDES